ncbi:MAG: 7-carboxy-7-deazaguanine synthase QueE [Gammaproteobacteria bacterium]|nr:7-carboxy-7-deazaguanine synthase QueE [Gammaproteobacteria bacterium]
MSQPDRLRITEIFYSLQGEADTAGWPTVFVRLTGCPLRCNYCDTEYAFQGGEWKGFGEIVDEISRYGTPYVCVTGGEPLAQKQCVNLLTMLCDLGYRVSLETSGAMDIAPVDSRVSVVMDLKTPASGEVEKNLMSNISELDKNDQVKFVICNREDYEWSKQMVSEHAINKKCSVLFSPSFGQVKPAELANWILQDKLNVRFQLQLHKILWGEAQGR